MRSRALIQVALSGMVAMLLNLGFALAQSPALQLPPPNANATPAEQSADKLVLEGKFAQAAQVLEGVVKSDPANGRAWFVLGSAQHELKQYAQAAESHRRAEAAGFSPLPLAMFRQVRAYAMAGDTEKAMQILERGLTQYTFSNVQAIETHADLAPLRTHPRYAAAVQQARRNADPCGNDPNYRQMDFWIGTWDVQPTGIQRAPTGATNVIEPLLGKCALLENWTPPNGPAGKGVHVYNARIQKWEQFWLTGAGNVVKFIGEFNEGAMNYDTEATTPAGQTSLRRTKIWAVDTDTVRQKSDQTTDGGKTWTPLFDLTYVRKK